MYIVPRETIFYFKEYYHICPHYYFSQYLILICEQIAKKKAYVKTKEYLDFALKLYYSNKELTIVNVKESIEEFKKSQPFNTEHIIKKETIHTMR